MKRAFLILVLVGAFMQKTGPVGAHEVYVIGGGAGVGSKITSLPCTITQPGFYYLTKDLTTSGSGIIVNKDNVTIDLMGFSLTGNDSYEGVIIPTGYFNVEIRNGTIQNFGYGIWAQGSGTTVTNHRILHVRTRNNVVGIELGGSGNLISHCTAKNVDVGISASTSLLSNNVAIGNATNISGVDNTLIDNHAKP